MSLGLTISDTTTPETTATSTTTVTRTIKWKQLQQSNTNIENNFKLYNSKNNY